MASSTSTSVTAVTTTTTAVPHSPGVTTTTSRPNRPSTTTTTQSGPNSTSGSATNGDLTVDVVASPDHGRTGTPVDFAISATDADAAGPLYYTVEYGDGGTTSNIIPFDLQGRARVAGERRMAAHPSVRQGGKRDGHG